jgi:2-dehydro-3-deoxyphosphogluconate aldolase/(4S)-4-hydroxy-2-oxoglutarate aldolase
MMSANNQMMVPKDVADRIANSGIIAVLVIDDVQDAVPVARTLLENGIGGMELTLRTDAAIESLRAIRAAVPEMFAGVGTILTREQVKLAKDNGAAFGVAPGYNRDVVAAAIEAGLPFSPGIATPSEIEGALSQGCRLLKFFHAEGMGGVDYLKGINAPYKHLGLRYIPLGGVSLANLRQYLAMKEIIAIGGSWIAPQELIKAKDWAAIARNAREASAIFREMRG